MRNLKWINYSNVNDIKDNILLNILGNLYPKTMHESLQ